MVLVERFGLCDGRVLWKLIEREIALANAKLTPNVVYRFEARCDFRHV
jgi:hypothetical protein